MESNEELAQLIGSRICHDLVSPIGAIGNGLELMQMISPDNSPEMMLVRESLDHANARIRFFRLAFGKASAEQEIGATEIETLLTDLGATGRLRYRWNGPQDTPRNEVQAVFLALMCLETAMPYGGKIRISQQPDGRWRLDADAQKLHWISDHWDGLAHGQQTGLTPNEVQFALLPPALKQLDRRLVVEVSEEGASLRF